MDWFRQALSCGPGGRRGAGDRGGGPGRPLRLADGSTPDPTFFAGLDGLLVGGGLTPAYHRVLLPHADAIREAP